VGSTREGEAGRVVDVSDVDVAWRRIVVTSSSWLGS